MFHGLRALFLIIPPNSLIALGVVLFICILSLFISATICKIRAREFQSKNHSLFGTILALFLVSEVAMVITTIWMLLFTNIAIGPLTRVHNEWGIAANNAYVDVVAYYIIYGLIYANLQFPSAFILRKAIGKNFAGFFVCFISFNSGIWVIGNMILGLLGIPY
jgi:hypothetical protein